MIEPVRTSAPVPALAPAEPSLAALEALDRVRRMGDGSDTARQFAGRSSRVPGGLLASRRAEVRYTAAGTDERDPHTLGADLQVLTEKFGWRSSLDVGALLGNWPGLVGQNVAEHCVPEVCEPPKLVVRASSTTWATQLRLMKTALLDRLERELGRRVIDDIEILGPAQRSWKKGKRSVKGRGPRDTYG